jgi:hypothetical protein
MPLLQASLPGTSLLNTDNVIQSIPNLDHVLVVRPVDLTGTRIGNAVESVNLVKKQIRLANAGDLKNLVLIYIQYLSDPA